MYSYEFFKPGYIYACQWEPKDTIFYNLICNINSANTVEFKLLLTSPHISSKSLIGDIGTWLPFIISNSSSIIEIGHIDNHPEFLL